MPDKKVKISKPLSMELWSFLEYVRGRKKGLIALIGTGLAFLITDNELAALFAGLVFEGLVSVAEFYLSKVEVEE